MIIIVLAVFCSYDTLNDYISQDTFQHFIITLIAYAGVYVLFGVFHIFIIYYFMNAYCEMEKNCYMLKSSPPPRNFGNLRIQPRKY